jgi:L-asparagine transporter-like permease
MVELELFTHLAEIAGVFVGFGALIAVRSGGASGPFEVGLTRGVVWMGLMTVVAGLAPIVISRYGVGEHAVWALSSALVLGGLVLFLIVSARTSEWQENMAFKRPRWTDLAETTVYALYVGAFLIASLTIMAGALPDLEAALYLTLVVQILLGAAWALLDLVYPPRSQTDA